MNVDSLEAATSYKNHIVKVKKLRENAASSMISCEINNTIDPFVFISAEPVRAAIDVACTDLIIELEEKLRKLGVRVNNPEPVAEDKMENWKREAIMLRTAWLRELGNKLLPKRHFIDALVLTTRDLRERVAGPQPKGELKDG